MRKLFLSLLLSSCFPTPSLAALTEADVLKLGMENRQLKAKQQAVVDQAYGDMQHAGRWDNPSIEFSQESLDIPGGTSEESSLWLKQRIDIAGVKRFEKELPGSV